MHDPSVYRSRPYEPVPPTPDLYWNGRNSALPTLRIAHRTRGSPLVCHWTSQTSRARVIPAGLCSRFLRIGVVVFPWFSRVSPPAPSSSFDYYHSLPRAIPTHIPSKQSPDPIQLPTLMSGDALYWKFDDRNPAFTYGPGWSNFTDTNAHESTLSYTSKDTNVTIQFYGTPPLPALHAT